MFEVLEDLTVDNILTRVSEYDIFKAYCPNFKEVGSKFSAPDRSDSDPSCIITSYNGSLWFKDFGKSDKAVTCFQYIMNKYNCSFIQSLGIINMDFNLGLKPYIEHKPSLNYIGLPDIPEITKKTYNTEKPEVIIEVNYRKWLQLDADYWYGKYYLTKKVLDFYKIAPINKLTLHKENTFNINIPIETYAFLITIENPIKRFKIYSPFEKKNKKWLSNCKEYNYQGYDQLPWLGEKLVITKSLKDVAVLSLFKIPAIAPQAESILIDYNFYQSLLKRFNTIYMFFDNDKAGIEGSRKNSDNLSIQQRFIPQDSGCKDISDFIDKYRYAETNSLVKHLFE